MIVDLCILTLIEATFAFIKHVDAILLPKLLLGSARICGRI